MEPSDTANKVCPQQMAGRQNVEEFEVLARGLFSRTVVSVEYRPGQTLLAAVRRGPYRPGLANVSAHEQ